MFKDNFSRVLHTVSVGMKLVDISFKHLQLKITQKFSLPAPKYGLTVDKSCQLSAYIDGEVQCGESVTETIRSLGSLPYVVGLSEEDAARNNISTLRDDFGLNIRMQIAMTLNFTRIYTLLCRCNALTILTATLFCLNIISLCIAILL